VDVACSIAFIQRCAASVFLSKSYDQYVTLFLLYSRQKKRGRRLFSRIDTAVRGKLGTRDDAYARMQ
jgi:hypothetical protein